LLEGGVHVQLKLLEEGEADNVRVENEKGEVYAKQDGLQHNRNYSNHPADGKRMAAEVLAALSSGKTVCEPELATYLGSV
jgi:hypothetical protein